MNRVHRFVAGSALALLAMWGSDARADYQSVCAPCHAATASPEIDNLPNGSGTSGSIRAANNRAYLDIKIENGMGGGATSGLTLAQRNAIVAEIAAGASVSAPVFTSAPAPSGQVGVPYSHTFTADSAPKMVGNDGLSSPFTSSGTLPFGLTLDHQTGVLSGTPTLALNYTGSVQASNLIGSPATQAFNITITRQTQATLTALLNGAAPPATIAFGATATLGTSGGSGTGAVSYGSSDSGVCSILGSALTAAAIGTCTITATKAQDTTYNAATAIFTLTVVQAPQAITFAALPLKFSNAAPFTVSATGGGSGNAVTFTATGVCTAGGTNGATITLSGSVGTCSVTANQASNTNYLAATPVVQGFSVVNSGEPFPPNCQMPLGWSVPIGNAGWNVAVDQVSSGGCSLKSNAIASGANAQISFTGTFIAGNVLFKRRVDSQANANCFIFSIDGVAQAVGGSCTASQGASGPAVPYALVTIPVTAGAHTLTWSYAKTSSTVVGADAAWIDEVVLPVPALVINTTGPVTGTFGQPLNFLVSASNSPWNFSATGLPVGLTILPAGLITGTPAAAGTSTIMVTVSNGAGSVTTALTAVIAKADQTIIFPALQTSYPVDTYLFAYGTGGGSGNPVVLTTSGPCEVAFPFTSSGHAGYYIHTTAGGTCTVTANQQADGNYNAAPPVGQSFAVYDTAQEVFPPACVDPAGFTTPATTPYGWQTEMFDPATEGGCTFKSRSVFGSIIGIQRAQTQYTGTFVAGNITFKRRVSGTGDNCFRFLIDGVPQSLGGTCLVSVGVSGEQPFASVSVPITAGAHTITFSFDAGNTGPTSSGSGVAWIDELVFPQAVLTVSRAGTGSGTVTSIPAGINCGAMCSKPFTAASTVALTATPTAGSYLSAWSGACSGSGACNVTMNSSQSVTATFSPVSVPSAPTGVSATPGNGTATVSFGAPALSGGSPITSYTATCGANNISDAGSPLVVAGLTNGTSVSCTVFATNVQGNGAVSGAVSVTPRTVPDAPTGVAVTPGNTQATVSFTPTPPAGNGGSAITGYTATCGIRSASGTGSPLAVTNLSNGVSVNCTVTATNAAGASAPSSAVPVTPRTIPGAPTSLSAASRDGRAIFNFFEPASDGGNAISGYTVSCNAGAITATGVVGPITVPGLVNGSIYTCTVFATNAAGNSPPSTSVQVTPAINTGTTLWTQVCTTCHTPVPSGLQLNGAGTTATVLSYVMANQSTMMTTPEVTSLTTAERTAIANYIAVQLPTTPQVIAFNAPGVINLSNQITLDTVSFQSLEVVTGPAHGTLSAFSGTTVTYTPTPGYAGSDSFVFRGKRTTPTALNGDPRTVTITVSAPAAPVITSAGGASGTNGVAFNYQIAATNSPTSFGASGLPNGLGVSTSSGAITGTPTVGGTFVTTISASNAGGPGSASLTITLNPGAQSISFPTQSPASQPYSPSPTNTFVINPTATSTSGLTVSYVSKTPSVCTVAGTTVTMLTAGTCTIGANQSGNASFTVAAEVTRDVTIAASLPGAPVIGTATPGNGQATIAFTAPANSGGTAITLYSTTCTPIGNGTSTLSPIVVGGLTNGTAYTCSVRASNNVGIGPASGTVMVTPAPTPTAPAIISANAATFTVNGPGSFSIAATGTPSTFTYSATGTLPAGVNFSTSTGVLSGTPTQAGTFPLTLGVSNGQPPPASQPFTLTVAKANQSISFTNPGTRTFSATPVALSALATSSLTVTFVSDSTGICTVAGANVTLVSVGTCQLRAQQVGNANFNAAADVPQSFSVVQGSQTITFGAQTSPRAFVANSTFALTPATASSALPIVHTSLTTSVCTIAGTTITMVRAGICTIAANQAGNASVSAAAQVTQSITLTGSPPGAPTIVTATGGDGRITVSFTPPASDGGVNIANYTATCGAGTVSGAASPLTVLGLTNGMSYSCSVTATNSVNTGPASATLMATPNALPGAIVWANTCGQGGCHGNPPFGTRLNVGGSSAVVLDHVVANATPLMTTMGIVVGTLSAQQKIDVAVYIRDFIPAVSAVTAAGTPVNIDVSGQVFLNTAAAALTSLQQVTAPANGTLSAFAGTSVTYTPNPGFTGTDSFTYRATQASLNTDIRTVSVTVQPAAPVITSALVASGTVNQAFSYQIAATNAPTSYGAAGLPAGLAVNTGTGVISGTPSAGGITMVTISAANAGGTGSATLAITVNLISQMITFGAQSSPRAFSQAGPVAISPTATGGASGNSVVYSSTTPAVCSVSGSTFTMLSAGICTIAANQAGNATYSAAAQATQSVAITGIAPAAPTIGTAQAGNTQATISFAAPVNTGGLPITSYTVNCNGVIVSGPASPIIVSGLTNGTTYSCTAQATNLAGTSPVSGVVMVNPVAIAFTGVVYSRKTHAGVDYDMPVDETVAISGAINVEPRAIGTGHRIVFEFNNTVSTVTSLSVQDAGMNNVGSASPSFDGNKLIITLTGIPDNKRVTVTATGVNGALMVSTSIGFLVGDVSNSRSVNASDISAVKARVGLPVNVGNNYLFDFDASGMITNADVLAAKARSGLVLP